MENKKETIQYHHIIQAVYDTAWIITRAKMTDIITFLDKKITGLNTQSDFSLQAKPTYQIQNGIALIPVFGVISQRVNLIQQFSGGTSTELLKLDIRAAMEDDEVIAVILDTDSPGGSVDDIANVSDLIYNFRSRKPIIAISNSLMASAAYWIGSAADRVIMGSPTAESGSIGVVAVHRDISKMEELEGVKTTEIYSGKYKRITSQYAPLTKEGEETIREKVDYIYSLFIEAVARNRGVSAGEVSEKMADGRLFTGQLAVDAGLADSMEDIDSLIKRLTTKSKPSTTIGTRREINMGEDTL